ncbi:MAG: asparaginase [Defluviitaleaceae bacterium]|nr:asparaginase [Defluviitaleaceae bacterium]
MKKKVAVIFTGGTISMTLNSETKAATPTLTSTDIMSLVHHIKDFTDLELIDFSAIPGPHMTPEKMMALSKVVEKKAKESHIDGIVITHGTDNLEETAFLLDLTVTTFKPVVVTGSMRNASELGYDGPSNLASAILTALHEDSRGRGVLVVLNDEINAAREVTKTHTMSLDTFKSLAFGPLGIVDSNHVMYYRKTTFKQIKLTTQEMVSDVALIKVASGMDSRLIDFLVHESVAGMVIEGMGRGNVPPGLMPGIQHAIEHNIPVVLVSRNPLGRLMPSYGYAGGGLSLKKAGVIMASNLNGQKARIALMLALGQTKNLDELTALFQQFSSVS